MEWFAWQRSVGLRGQESLIRRLIEVGDGMDVMSMSPLDPSRTYIGLTRRLACWVFDDHLGF